jgi:FHS family L-fucose permease-like MFS transporter
MKVLEKKYLLSFILVTLCFALWGFANDITNPMVKAFSKIFRMSVSDGTLVQVAFYGGYFCMALPAALFIRKFSYKAGLLMGLGLYAIEALMFLPARYIGSYYPFLFAYFILTCGLSFLETTANPYILSMGDSENATRRLNLAQAFNPIGSLLGMYVAMNFIQSKLNPLSTSERAVLNDVQFEAIKNSDLAVLSAPYVIIGILLVLMFVLFALFLPKSNNTQTEKSDKLSKIISRLWNNKRYRYGVVAQFFYVGVQIMCWTFIIQYGTRVFMNEGMTELEAEVTSQRYNIVAMIIFCASRFVCTWLMKYIKAPTLLGIFSIIAIILTGSVVIIDGRLGMYCLVAISACMSLMFPTIYGIALAEVGEDAKLGAAGLIMAILGGSLLPPLQAIIIDRKGLLGVSSINISFIIPLLSFVVIMIYALNISRNRI